MSKVKVVFFIALSVGVCWVAWQILDLFGFGTFGKLSICAISVVLSAAKFFSDEINKQSEKQSESDEDDPFDETNEDNSQKFSLFSPYDPVERRWRITGTKYEEREAYIIQNAESIKDGVSFRRDIALEFDPNAIAVMHNDKVLGFFPKEHAAILAPVFDKHADKIRHSVSVWINERQEFKGLYIRLSTRFKSSKDDFKEAVDKCAELAHRSIE